MDRNQDNACGVNDRLRISKLDGRRRGKVEIIAAVLAKVRKPTMKTQIMCECNLSFSQLRRYLRFMSLRGLIRSNAKEGRMTYRITSSGRSFLNSYNNIARLLQTQKPRFDHFKQRRTSGVEIRIMPSCNQKTEHTVNKKEKLLYENC
jgi:predicted transcriptional regulator